MSSTFSPIRCPWVHSDRPLEIEYHDREWGVPMFDEDRMFEYLMLETAQAGLSWYTILRKREGYRKAFAGFDAERVARFTEADVARLVGDASIVRNRLKIKAAITNAQAVLELREHAEGLAQHLWAFVGGTPIVNTPRVIGDYVATSDESDAMSKDLRRRGFKFVGSTICYAHMQATGMVMDHSVDCFRHSDLS